MIADKTILRDELRQEGLVTLFHILMANALTGILATLFYYFLADVKSTDWFSTVGLPLTVEVIFVTLLLAIHFVVKNVTTKGWQLTLLAYISYITFNIYYFSYDISALIALMALLYMLATQIMMDFRVSLIFGISGLVMTGFIYYFRLGHNVDIGLGFTATMAQSIILGIYASYRYITLLRRYHDLLNSQLSKLLDSEERNALIHRASREIIWDFNVTTGMRSFPDMELNEDGDRLSTSSQLEDWVKDIHPEDAQDLLSLYQKVYNGSLDFFEKEFRQISKAGKLSWYSAKVISLKNEAGQVEKMAGSYTYIQDRKMKELKIEHLAFYDELTGLPNRTALLKDIEDFIHDSQGADEAILFYIDIQNFKEFNSSFGHSLGDQLIVAVAHRLKDGHLPGKLYQLTTVDIGLLYMGSSEMTADLAETILDLFQTPFLIEGKEVFVSVMIGIASYPNTARDGEALLRNADTALYHCRKNNLLSYLEYDIEMTDSVNYRLNLNKHMRQALKRDEFHMVYQPIIRLTPEGYSIYGFEALIRWVSPNLGFVRPDHFIPFAEETGLIMNIGTYVLRTACRFAKEITDIEPDVVLSINLSAKQVSSEAFLPELLQIVSEAQVNPRNISLEITETSFIESFEGVQYKLNYLRERGFRIALDDFGTGYSSLNYLGQLSIDTLKIDKSFTAKIDATSSDFYLIKSIIALATDLKIDFVAEGVETSHHLDLLKRIHCPIVQGYYFSKPLPPSEALQYLKKGHIEPQEEIL